MSVRLRTEVADNYVWTGKVRLNASVKVDMSLLMMDPLVKVEIFYVLYSLQDTHFVYSNPFNLL